MNAKLESILLAYGFPASAITSLGQIIDLTFPSGDKAVPDQKEVLDWLIESTQRNWLRPANSERWELEDSFTLKEKRSELLSPLKSLGFTDKVTPTKLIYKHGLLLSAVANKYERRLRFLADQCRDIRIENLYLVGGSRQLHPIEERAYVELLGSRATELDMLIYLFNKFVAEGLVSEKINLIPVDTAVRNENGILKRPNTEDTTYSWLYLEPPEGEVLVISCQPYITYQQGIVANLLEDRYGVETIGPSLRDDEPISVILDSIARYLYCRRQSVAEKIL